MIAIVFYIILGVLIGLMIIVVLSSNKKKKEITPFNSSFVRTTGYESCYITSPEFTVKKVEEVYACNKTIKVIKYTLENMYINEKGSLTKKDYVIYLLERKYQIGDTIKLTKL